MLPLKAHSMFCLTLSPEKVLKQKKATWHAWQETSGQPFSCLEKKPLEGVIARPKPPEDESNLVHWAPSSFCRIWISMKCCFFKAGG